MVMGELYTLPETNSLHPGGNGWLEDDCFFLGQKAHFSGPFAVSFREGFFKEMKMLKRWDDYCFLMFIKLPKQFYSSFHIFHMFISLHIYIYIIYILHIIYISYIFTFMNLEVLQQTKPLRAVDF